MATKKSKKVFKIILYIFLFTLFVFLSLILLFHFGFFSSLSSIKFDKDKLNYLTAQANVYTLDNNILKQNIQNTKNINYEDIPKHVIDAFISIEDKNFYNHKGVNYKRIVKALLKNFSNLKIKEGASTISQQLIKNTHLTSEKTIKRKLNELLLTKQLEKNMTKNEIMTAYLNAIYFGSGAFGINNASQRFFSKDVSRLGLAESATLAGIIKSPKLYSPISEQKKCIERRNLVLNEMYKDGKISKKELERSKNEPLKLNINKNFLGNNTYYSASIDEACEILNITEKDLILKKYKIFTYMDEKIQKDAENQILNLDKNYVDYKSIHNPNCLIMVADNKTGGIAAFSGKSDYNLLNIYRQPGSTLKPIISYAPAIEYDKINPLTPILDEKININGYVPNNYNNKTYGWISAKQALAKSLNIPSIKVLEYVGVEKAKNFAKSLGVKFDKNDNGYSLALGGMTKGIKFLDLLNCYQSFANNGKQIKLGFVKEIQTKDGLTIYKHNEEHKQVMKTSTAFLINNMLKESVLTGTSKKLKLDNIDICAKTGTVGLTNSKDKENTDAWSISYTPEISMCVWLGCTDNNMLDKNITGGSVPTSIAQNMYKEQKNNKLKFEIPYDIQQCEINDLDYVNSNKINLCCKNTPDRYKRLEYFAITNMPKKESTMFKQIDSPKINLVSCSRNKVEIELDSKKFLTYTLFKCYDDKTEKIVSVSNKQGKIILTDRDILEDKLYTYFIETKLNYNGYDKSDNNIFNNIAISNQIKVYVAQKSPLIIHKSGLYI